MGRKLVLITLVSLILGAMLAFAWGLWVFISPQLWLLRTCHHWAGSWGQGVLLAAVLNHLLCAVFLYGIQPAAKLKALDPEIQSLELLYVDDQSRKNAEIYKLYQRDGITGWTIGQPMLLVPVLLWLIVSYFVALWRIPELRGAAFLWIPDLSAPDPLYRLPLLHGVLAALRTLLPGKPAPSSGRPGSAVVSLVVVAGISCLLPASFVLSLGVTQLLTLVQQSGRRLIVGKEITT